MKKLIFILLFVANLGFSQSSFNMFDFNSRAPENYELYGYSLDLDTFETNVGPNKSLFGYYYFGFGGPLGSVEGEDKGEIIPSSNFNYGFLGKIRINNVLAIGGHVQYDRTAFKMVQNGSKVFPDTVQYDKQKIAFHSIQAAPFIRFNFDPLLGRKRGNYIGDYIDFGPYIGYSFGIRQVLKYEEAGEKIRVVKRGMDYLDRINYGWTARLGFNHFSFYGTYRLSNWIDQDKYKFTLPRYSLGIQIGIYSN